MHAILITPETIKKIHDVVPKDSVYGSSAEVYLRLQSRWYMIKDYVTLQGQYYEYTILPAYIIETAFIIDKEKLEKEWDSIYRLG